MKNSVRKDLRLKIQKLMLKDIITDPKDKKNEEFDCISDTIDSDLP